MRAIGRLFQELRRRKVFRSTAIYVGAAWVALQGAGLAFPALAIPDAAIRYVWIGAIAGLPLALLFAWRYQVTAEGIVRTAPSPAEGGETLPLGRPDYLILGVLLLVAAAGGYRLLAEIRRAPATIQLGAEGSEISANSVAVLPLENVTGDPEQAYFAAGMHEALTTTLSKIRALTVKASRSTRVYENVVQPVQQTARELGAAHLVEGSVFRTGDRVQIEVRLVAASSGEIRWSESYERDIEDVLTLQSEVARAIAEEIRVELTPEEESRLASRRRVNPEVYETYLRGMYHLNQYTPGGIQRGLELLHRAVEMDPEDPLAYAGLAQGYTLIGHGADPPPGAFRQAREAAVKALELDPLFPEAHAAMAEIQLYWDWDWEGAERSFRRALQLNPSLEFAHAHYAWYHQLTGDVESALEHMQRAQQIAPTTPIFTAWLGWLYWGDGQLDRAVAEARRSLELNASFPWGLYVLGGAYATQERYDEALATYERLLEIQPNLGRWGLGFTYARMGRADDARRVVGRLAEDPGQKDVMIVGLIHAALGDEEEAVRWLERARDEHVDWFPYVGTRAGYDAFTEAAIEALGDQPSYREMVAELGIPESG